MWFLSPDWTWADTLATVYTWADTQDSWADTQDRPLTHPPQWPLLLWPLTLIPLSPSNKIHIPTWGSGPPFSGSICPSLAPRCLSEWGPSSWARHSRPWQSMPPSLANLSSCCANHSLVYSARWYHLPTSLLTLTFALTSLHLLTQFLPPRSPANHLLCPPLPHV